VGNRVQDERDQQRKRRRRLTALPPKSQAAAPCRVLDREAPQLLLPPQRYGQATGFILKS
jgi:hypothetical protein